jgi:hypothetical protein
MCLNSARSFISKLFYASPLDTFEFGDNVVKLLGIVGSPRKGGNTEIVMKEALKAAMQEGAETELIHLVDFNLKP